MPIQRNINIELDKKEVCDFLKKGDDLYDDRTPTPSNYKTVGKRKYLKNKEGSGHLSLYTSKIDKYRVLTRENRFRIAELEGITVTKHPVRLKIYALLFVRNDVSSDIQNLIEAAFTDFDPEKDSLDDVETEVVSGGVPMSAYQIYLSFALERDGDPINDDSHLKEILRNNDEEIILELKSSREECGVKKLTFEGQDDFYEICDPNIKKCDSEEIVGSPDDLNNISDRLIDSSDLQKNDCGGLDTKSKKLAQWDLPEYKIEMERQDIKFCGIKIGSTDIPVLYRRVRTHYVFGAVIGPKDIVEYFEKMILKCIESSAIAGGIIYLVTRGVLEMALLAFRLEMVKCLSQIPDQAMRCIDIRLPLTTTSTGWVRQT